MGRPTKGPPVPGENPRLTERQWKVLRFEFDNPEASLREIKKATGVAHQVVARWRADPHYLHGRTWLLTQLVSDGLNDRLNRKEAKVAREREAILRKYMGSRELALELFHSDVERSFQAQERLHPGTWSVTSPFDGRTYTDPRAYIDSVRESATAFPVGHLPTPGSSDWNKLLEDLERLSPKSG